MGRFRVYCLQEGAKSVQAVHGSLIRAGRYGVSVAAGKSAALILALFLFCSVAPGCRPEELSSSALPASVSKPAPEQERDADEETIHWEKPLNEGPDNFYYFVEAVSGKKFKPKTYELLRGVTEVTVEDNKIVFCRVDRETLKLGSDTERGGKFFDDWEKAKINLESKFGTSGREFLESIDRVRVAGDRIEVVRKGKQDTTINLGERLLHRAFDLRGLRFRQLNMRVDKSEDHPTLKDINGVTALINAPGFSFPVEVKEFGKIRLEKGNDIRVGVRNPVPGAVRAILFLPSILRFHFMLPRKEK
jgi:hypothetical protein